MAKWQNEVTIVHSSLLMGYICLVMAATNWQYLLVLQLNIIGKFMSKKSFASDNYAGIHADILQAIIHANGNHASAYGNDEYTTQAIQTFKTHFGDDIDVFFVFNGTAANVTSLSALNRSYNAVICADSAHIQNDECGAPEKFTGCKLLLAPTQNGKLTVDAIERCLQRKGDQHFVQARVISISQSTEYGTVYTPREIQAIAEFAHQNHLFLHMDGARISNAAVSLNLELKAISKDLGVDVLSFGGTKNGMMLGEAVVFFNRELAKDFLFIRKQSMQLASKMRFISAQFHALLSNDLWRKNAAHSNAMAQLLAKRLLTISSIRLTQPVEANAIFAILPKNIVSTLQDKFHFYVWNENLSEVRLMTSFDTTEEDVTAFFNCLSESVAI
jgi:threonine aldolase